MAFNPIAFLRLAGLIPGGFLASLPTALGRLTVRFGSTLIAGKLATTILRTAGFLMNQTGFLPGLPIASTPATRLLTGIPTLVTPLGFPGINAFLAGFAYRDRKELADGWLSLFGDLILQDVPLVDTSTERAIDALARLDFVTFGTEVAGALSQDIGLVDLAAFFNGIAQIERDFQELGLPTASPAPWFFGGVIGTAAFLDSAFRAFGGGLGGLFEEPPRPPSAEELQGFAEDLEKAGREIRRGTELPVTPTGVERVFRTFRRLRRRFGASRELLRILKDQGPSDKAIRAARRALGLR